MANRTVTVKASGGDYTSLAAAYAGEQGSYHDLVTNQMILTIELYASAAPDSSSVLMFDGEYHSNSSYYMVMIVPASERFAGTWNTGKYYLSAGISGQNNYLRMTGIQVSHGGASLIGTGLVADKCYFVSTYRNNLTITSGAIVKNSIIKTASRQLVTVHTGAKIINCTCLGNASASYGHALRSMDYGGGPGNIINCVSFSNTAGADYGTIAAGTTYEHNASEDATADDCGYGDGHLVQKSVSSMFTDAANGDYTLKAGSPLIGAGTTGTDVPTDDILGNTRPGTPSIGAFDVEAAAPTFLAAWSSGSNNVMRGARP